MVGELRTKTKLQPLSVDVELWLSLAIYKMILWRFSVKISKPQLSKMCDRHKSSVSQEVKNMPSHFQHWQYRLTCHIEWQELFIKLCREILPRTKISNIPAYATFLDLWPIYHGVFLFFTSCGLRQKCVLGGWVDGWLVTIQKVMPLNWVIRSS